MAQGQIRIDLWSSSGSVVRVGADIAPVITAFTRRRPFGHQQAARHARAGEGKLQMQPVDRRMMARSAFGTVRGR